MSTANEWHSGNVSLYLGDCLTVLPDVVEDGSVALCFVDPPYNIGIFAKIPEAEYLAWCEQWIALCSRKLKANGAFWVSHKNPRLLCKLSEMIAAQGRGLVNWVTWDKYNGCGDLQGFMDGYTVVDSLRSFQVMAEYLIYHTDEGQWTAQCDHERGFIFEPLRAYLADEWARAGLNFEDARQAVGCASGSGLPGHWFTRSQWILPTEDKYHTLRAYANSHDHNGEYLRREYEYLRREYEDLRREYEDLRRKYEDLRYTFNNPGKMSSVWQIPPAPRNGHPTPKPPELLRRIVTITSNPGDLVLDPMMGSGTTGQVCAEEGRAFVGCELAARWFNLARDSIAHAQAEAVQPVLL